MRFVLSAKEAALCDKNTTDLFGVDSPLLMERAALFSARTLMETFPDKGLSFAVLAGKGNNAGDGIACARILYENGYGNVGVFFAFSGQGLSPAAEKQTQIAGKYGIRTDLDEGELLSADVIIDALFGTGLSRQVDGATADLIRKVNESGKWVLSIDLPSGIDATSGEILGEAVKSTVTTTYSFLKRGHLLYPGRQYCGKVLVENIGITEHAFNGHQPEAFLLEKEDVRRLLPPRLPDSHKGTYGRVLVIGGSPGMAGAAVFAAEAAALAGAGLVSVLTAEENRIILQEKLPEAVLTTYSGKCPDEVLDRCLASASAVVIGPGLSQSKNAEGILRRALEVSAVPMVIDADGLNILSENLTLLKRPHTDLVLTPHPGELARLIGEPYEMIKGRLFSVCGEFSRNYGVTVVAKSASSMVFEPYRDTCINATGNSSLSTGGSGDILAGLIGGLIACGMKASDAARAAVFIHGLAGERAGDKVGERSAMARHILAALPEIILEVS